MQNATRYEINFADGKDGYAVIDPDTNMVKTWTDEESVKEAAIQVHQDTNRPLRVVAFGGKYAGMGVVTQYLIFDNSIWTCTETLKPICEWHTCETCEGEGDIDPIDSMGSIDDKMLCPECYGYRGWYKEKA